MNEYSKKHSLGGKVALWISVCAMIFVLLTASVLALPPAALAEPGAEEKTSLPTTLEEALPAAVIEETEEVAALFEEEATAAAEEELDAKELLTRFIAYLCEDILNFDIDNEDPLVVSLAHFFTGYDGQFVFFGNWESGRSGSFGRVMGLHEYERITGNVARLAETLKHEHGHYEQYKQIGLLKYIFAIAIPSILHDPADYYSQPWEVTADILGGVTTHRHTEGAEEAGEAYLDQVKNADILTVIGDCFKRLQSA